MTTKQRHAAGQDPEKRRQIMDGALQVFMEKGYDSSSMSDICRAAGVSKGTLYVYFADKEDLFQSLVGDKRTRTFAGIEEVLEGPLPLEAKLRDYGLRLATAVCSDVALKAQRIIISMADRMPQMGRRFYDAAAEVTVGELARVLARADAEGTLRVPDPRLAAYQFIELSMAGLWRRRLFGRDPQPPDAATIERTVDAAVTMIMASYAVPPET